MLSYKHIREVFFFSSLKNLLRVDINPVFEHDFYQFQERTKEEGSLTGFGSLRKFLKRITKKVVSH